MPNDILRREAGRLRNLAATCAQQRDYETAYRLLKMVVDIEESDVAVEKEWLAADFQELGSICVMLDSMQEAQQYWQRAVDLRSS